MSPVYIPLPAALYFMPIWLLWSVSSATGCSCAETIIPLPFNTLPIITNQSLNTQYGLMPCLNSFLLDGQPLYNL